MDIFQDHFFNRFEECSVFILNFAFATQTEIGSAGEQPIRDK